MKKLLGILVLCFLFSNNLLAKNFQNSFLFFDWWLEDNGFNQYLEKDSNGKLKNNLNIKTKKGRWGIDFHSNPNRDTLIYYFYKYQFSHLTGDSNTMQWEQVEVKPSKKPYEFKFNLIEDKFVKKQMQTKGILSYLYFQGDHVLIDEISPKDRLGEFINNETQLMSMSMNKSVTSYILGHAICDGYIGGVDTRINDWPLLSSSLYENQKLIDLLNMRAGDQKYISEWGQNTTGHPLADLQYEYETNPISTTIKFFFGDTVKSKSTYNYNGFVPQLLFNYIKHKTGDDFQKLLDKIFKDKAKIKHSVYFGKIRHVPEELGNAHPMIRATRFDYLRISKAIMDDYQNDTCVGKYLKEIYKRRISKGGRVKDEPAFNAGSSSYGGQFHMGYSGLKKRVIFGMGGYGGNKILIDVENSRIVVLNSLHYNNKRFKYSHTKLLIDPIKKGK